MRAIGCIGTSAYSQGRLTLQFLLTQRDGLDLECLLQARCLDRTSSSDGLTALEVQSFMLVSSYLIKLEIFGGHTC